MFGGLFLLHAAATPEIYTLSLHDALPISGISLGGFAASLWMRLQPGAHRYLAFVALLSGCLSVLAYASDRKSTRLNSSHTVISYAVFCLKKKKHAQSLVILVGEHRRSGIA